MKKIVQHIVNKMGEPNFPVLFFPVFSLFVFLPNLV